MPEILYDKHGNEVVVNQRRGCLRGGCLQTFIVIVLLIWGASYFVDTTDDNTSSTSQEDVSTIIETDDPFEYAAHDVFGDKLIDYIANTLDPIHYTIQTSTAGLSKNMDIKDANFKTVRFLKEIQDLEYDSISILFFGDFIDTYGNSEKEKAISFDFNKETVDKINFDNFLPENLPDIADQYWIHPAYDN